LVKQAVIAIKLRLYSNNLLVVFILSGILFPGNNKISDLLHYNSKGPKSGPSHVLRDGNFDALAADCRSAARFWSNSASGVRSKVHGFRLVAIE